MSAATTESEDGGSNDGSGSTEMDGIRALVTRAKERLVRKAQDETFGAAKEHLNQSAAQLSTALFNLKPDSKAEDLREVFRTLQKHFQQGGPPLNMPAPPPTSMPPPPPGSSLTSAGACAGMLCNGSGASDTRAALQAEGYACDLLAVACSPSARYGGGERLPAAAAEAQCAANQWPGSAVQLPFLRSQQLHEKLREHKPKRFLFCGHGDVLLRGQCTLGFTDAQGQFTVAEPQHVAELLGAQAQATPPELVHASGCKTFELGKEMIHQGIKFVVCWKTKVHDEAAAVFSSAFYRELRAGKSYQRAFKVARLVLMGEQVTGALDTGHPSQVPNKFALVDPDDTEEVRHAYE